MSSFMVSNETLNILANYISQEQPFEINYAFHYERGDGKKIYEALRDLNHRALCERYGEKAQEMWDVNQYEYQEIPDIILQKEEEEILCRLECFLYQCDEGLISSRDDIYIGLDRLAGAMARDLIGSIYTEKIAEQGWWD